MYSVTTARALGRIKGHGDSPSNHEVVRNSRQRKLLLKIAAPLRAPQVLSGGTSVTVATSRRSHYVSTIRMRTDYPDAQKRRY
jgi:hypothetical protein